MLLMTLVICYFTKVNHSIKWFGFYIKLILFITLQTI